MTTNIAKKVKMKNMIIVSLLPFLFYAGAAAVFPYYNLVFRAKGLNLEQIGILLLVPRIFSLFSIMIWGGIADSFNIQKSLLPLALFLTIPFIFLSYHYDHYETILIYYCIYSFCSAPIIALIDNTILDIAGKDYGIARVWGSVGWGIGSIITGEVAEKFGLVNSLWIYGIFIGLAIIIAFLVPESPKIEAVPFWKNIGFVSQDKHWIGFLLAVTLSGYGLFIISNYSPLFLEDLGASMSFIGLTNLSCILWEIPVFLFTPLLLRKFDRVKLIWVSILAMFLRCALFSIIKTSAPAFYIQMLHAPSYALLFSAGVAFVRDISPKGFSASGQALFSTMYNGAGGIIGALGGSMLYEYYGPQVLFSSGAIAALIGMLLLGLFFYKKPVKALQS